MRMPDVNDLIKRGDALEIVKRTNGDYVTAWSNIVALDAIDPESLRPTAHWEAYQEDVYEFGPSTWSGKCSACKEWSAIPHVRLAHYCPKCGAKMES